MLALKALLKKWLPSLVFSPFDKDNSESEFVKSIFENPCPSTPRLRYPRPAASADWRSRPEPNRLHWSAGPAQIVSEIGSDMSRWPTAKQFTSWLALAPNSKVSGGRARSPSRKA